MQILDRQRAEHGQRDGRHKGGSEHRADGHVLGEGHHGSDQGVAAAGDDGKTGAQRADAYRLDDGGHGTDEHGTLDDQGGILAVHAHAGRQHQCAGQRACESGEHVLERKGNGLYKGWLVVDSILEVFHLESTFFWIYRTPRDRIYNTLFHIFRNNTHFTGVPGWGHRV